MVLAAIALVNSAWLFSVQPTRPIDKKCLNGDCVFLSLSDGLVFFERTGTSAGKARIGEYDSKIAGLLPPVEAALSHLDTQTGWTVVASSFLPPDFDIEAPRLRIRAVDGRGNETVMDEGHVYLHKLMSVDAFSSASRLVIHSSIGSHAYDVRTKVWILPQEGNPQLILDVVGLLESVQAANPERPPGLWIEFETYDGVDGATKGRRLSFVRWDADAKRFIQ